MESKSTDLMSQNSMSRTSGGKFQSRRDLIKSRGGGAGAEAGPRRISDLRKMEFGTDLHSRLAFIRWASRVGSLFSHTAVLIVILVKRYALLYNFPTPTKFYLKILVCISNCDACRLNSS